MRARIFRMANLSDLLRNREILVLCVTGQIQRKVPSRR